MGLAATVRRRHADTLEAIETCADAVAASWDADRVHSATAVVEPFEERLARRGTLAAVAAILEDAIAASGHDPPAHIVPAPPYVVVTSRGPIARATLPAGRLVVHLAVFEVTDSGDYRRRPLEVTVEWH